MICVRRQWRRAGRQKNIPSRVRLNDVAETGPGFGKTLVNDRVIDHQDATHGYLPRRRFDVSAVPLVIGTAFDSIAQRFCLVNQHTIAILPQIAALPALHWVWVPPRNYRHQPGEF